VFLLSLVGQGASHLTRSQLPPTAVVVFVSVLPVTILALIAVLIHLRHLDRAEADEVATQNATEAALASEQEARQSLAAEFASFRQEAARAVEGVKRETAGVRQELAEATAQAETLTRRLETAKQVRKAVPARKSAREEVAELLKEDPGISVLAASKRLKRSRDTLKPIFDELRPGGEVRQISEARHA
jgi:small-conductance mechanosensitive channel